jgi:hypothetical protein
VQRFCGIALMRQPRAGYRPLDARKKGSNLSAVFEAFLTPYGLFVFVVELSRQLGLQLGLAKRLQWAARSLCSDPDLASV